MQSYGNSSHSTPFFSAPSCQAPAPPGAGSKKTPPQLPTQYRTPREAFGLALHELRTRKGWSIADLAERCQFKPIYIEMLEREINQPVLANLVTIADALDIRLSELSQRIENYLYAPVLHS